MHKAKTLKSGRCGTETLTPRKLYAAHYEWFRKQREQLGQFLALTAGHPRAMFSLPKPSGHTLASMPPGLHQGTKPAFSIAAATTTTTSNLMVSRAELLNLMREAIDEFEARKLAHTRKLLLRGQFHPGTLKRWEERLTGQRRTQLTRQVEQLCKVYLCLARGIVETRCIASQTDLSLTTAGAYRLNLLNAVLGSLLKTPSRNGLSSK